MLNIFKKIKELINHWSPDDENINNVSEVRFKFENEVKDLIEQTSDIKDNLDEVLQGAMNEKGQQYMKHMGFDFDDYVHCVVGIIKIKNVKVESRRNFVQINLSGPVYRKVHGDLYKTKEKKWRTMSLDVVGKVEYNKAFETYYEG